MGQLFNRIGRVVRAGLNSKKSDHQQKNYLNVGAALTAGGAVSGASIGKGQIATRYEKKAENYLTMMTIASIMMWL